MKVIKCKNYEEVSYKAAVMIMRDIIVKPNLVLGLATGSTPLGLYKNLIKANKDNLISFQNVITYNLDEYLGIPQNHVESYYSYMHNNLFKHIDIQHENINIPGNDLSKRETLCKEYNDKLAMMQIDTQILGIGSNGHIGFNEPGTPLSNETFIVKLDQQTRVDNSRFFENLDNVPKYAITMGIKNIMSSKKIILIASGAQKAEAVKKMVNNPISKDIPASVLQLHPNCTNIVDEAAGLYI